MKKDYQEHELTAFLLDELDDERRKQIAEILSNSESARRELEELQATMEDVGEALAAEPVMALGAERRSELHAEFEKPRLGVAASPALQRPKQTISLRWAGALAAAACFVVVLVLSWDVAKRPTAVSPVQEQMQKEMAQQPAAGRQGGMALPGDVIILQEQEEKQEEKRDALSRTGATGGTSAIDKVEAVNRSEMASAVPAFKGKVTDHTGAPLPGASVMVASQKSNTLQSTLTDTRGQFAVPPLPEGEYKIQAVKSGFTPNQVGPVRAEEGKTREVQLALQSGAVQQESSTFYFEGPKAGRLAPPPAQAPREKSFGGVPGGVVGGVLGPAPGGIRTEIAPSRARIPEKDEEFNTESYDYQADNEMTAVAKDPLSTFSIDVDTASYSNLRRFLREGRLPPPDAVRIEEMINYFPYDYEPSHDRTPFAVNTEVAQAPWAPAHRLVRVALKGRELPPAERPAANLVFLLDVSGSMDSPVKLPLVKQAMRLLIEKLESRDRVAMVVYAGASGLVLPSTSGAEKQRILDALDQLQAGGSTNGGAGIQLAYREALANLKSNGINRVILATDGDFNVGVTNQGELVREVQQQAARGVYLTALGFGMGNYKDSMLEKLADKGNGNYAYIDSLDEARKVLVEQMGGTLVTIAKDVKIQVEFNPLEVTAYRLIGYENRVMAHQDFDDDRKDAGEIGAGHTVTALYEVVPIGVPVDLPQGEPLKYQRKTAAATARGELLTVKLRYKLPNEETSRKLEVPVVDRLGTFAHASDDFRFAAAVAGFGMILRNSPFKGSATFQSMMEIADTSRQFDPQGYRSEFVRLIGEASRLAGGRR